MTTRIIKTWFDGEKVVTQEIPEADFYKPRRTKEEALKLALEAMECALSDDKPYIAKSKEAIATIKEALAQPEHQAKRWCMKANGCKTECGNCPNFTQLEQQAEPVAWIAEVELSVFARTPKEKTTVEIWKKPVLDSDAAIYTTPPAAQPAPVQEPVACAVCNKVHAILDADESKIIRNAKDGYPDGRAPRILTLQERVTALCVYASDWKRWCLEKENTAPPAAQRQWVGLTQEERLEIRKRKWWDWEDAFDIDGFMQAVETKLKEKNT